MNCQQRLLPSHWIFFLFVFFLNATPASAQKSTRLSEGWEFLRQDLGSIWEAVRPVGAGNPESVPIWTKVSLPHCYNADDAVDPDLNYYQGPAWYRTLLDIENPYPSGRILLHFEGAGQKTQVYLFTQKLGEHQGGYDEFSIDITEAVARWKKDTAQQRRYKGKIPISIRSDNSRDTEMIPSDLSDFNLYGGIYRHLNLVYLPELSVEQLFPLPTVDRKGQKGKLQLSARLRGLQKGKASAHYRLLDPAGKQVYQSALMKNFSDSLLVFPDFQLSKPRLWSPESPQLYRLEIELSQNGQVFRDSRLIGFRHFEFEKQGPFYLNGKRLLLRGTHRHEDHAGVAAAMSDAQMRDEMMLIKDMGANFIRLGHYQQSRQILNLCDSLGLLVWEEIPWCRGGLGGDSYRAQARSMLKNMIEQHYHHPSIILWGLGNENDWPGDFPEFQKDSIRQFMTELHQLSHRLDPSRLTAIRRCDFCKDIVDVYSPSIWAGWYRGVYSDYKLVSEKEMKAVNHFLHVEWGGDSHAGRHSENPDRALQNIRRGQGADERAGDASLIGGAARVSKDGDWSESYIVNLMDWHLKEQETMPWLTGTAQWVFKDFSTPVRPDNPVPYMNQKGLVERDLTKKEAYYVFQSYWSNTPMVHIYGHSWPVRWGTAGEEKMIKVFSNCEEAELFVNGQSQGKRVRNSQDFPAAGLRWNVVLNKGDNKIWVKATTGKQVLYDSIQVEYETRVWGKPAQLEIKKLKELPGETTVQVRLLDSAGVPCLDSRAWVRFGHAGDGQLIDNQGTAGGSRKVQLANGRASIRITNDGGNMAVSATVEEVPTAILHINTPHTVIDKIANLLRPSVMEKAAWAMQQKPVTVTASRAERSAGGANDFYSEGDYWWPDPANPNGPHIQKDGMSNPDNFVAHRRAMIRFSQIMGALGSAYVLTGEQKYVSQALQHCRAWFAEPATRMNPHLLYAQAIKGRATGRGIGIIDAIQLMEVVQSLKAMEHSPAMNKALLEQCKQWFRDFLKWLTTHPYGRDEMNAKNNHGTCWVMQTAVFARFVGNDSLLQFCRDRYKTVLLPDQMAADGSFPLELKRTKPYGYSLFNLDAMATICQVASNAQGDLWNFTTADGRSIEKGIEYMFPFVKDKKSWPLPPDVMYWNEWPVAQPFLVFGSSGLRNEKWLAIWKGLDHSPQEEEVVRNLPVRNPLIWLNK